MTAGDMIRSPSRKPFTRQRLSHSRDLYSSNSGNRQAVILLLGLTAIWFAVLWMAVFGSRPHTYLLILAGTYTVGVLSGAGISGLTLRRGSRDTASVSAGSGEPIDAEVRSVN
jgi:hypothetical protein